MGAPTGRPSGDDACGAAARLLRTAAVCAVAWLTAGGPAFAGREAGASADDLPFPARLESVLDRGDLEGHRVSILRFETALPPNAVLQRSRTAWSTGPQSPVIDVHGGSWRMLSTLDAGRVRTLQVRARAGGGSEGMLSVWAAMTSLGDARPEGLGAPDPQRYLPTGATVLRRLGATDGGRRSASVVALVDGGPRWTADAMHAALTAAAFVRAPLVREPARWYRRAGAEVAFTVQPHDGRTAVVVHLTLHPARSAP